MVHCFRLAGQQIVLDEASGYAAPIDEITCEILSKLSLPLSDTCPSSVLDSMTHSDSCRAEQSYASVLAMHKDGLLYTDTPFDTGKAPSLCMLTSISPTDSLDGIVCPVLLCDTDNTENALQLCRQANARGLHITVILTCDGEYPCDRLIVPADQYTQYRTSAPTVGVRFGYDAVHPNILAKLTAYAEKGITLMDAYPINPGECKEGEQDALLQELARTAEALFLRRKGGQPIEFLPFSVHGKNAKHGIGAHRNERCLTCSHRMICGGRRLSFADCEIKKTLADCAVFLSLC